MTLAAARSRNRAVGRAGTGGRSSTAYLLSCHLFIGCDRGSSCAPHRRTNRMIAELADNRGLMSTYDTILSVNGPVSAPHPRNADLDTVWSKRVWAKTEPTPASLRSASDLATFQRTSTVGAVPKQMSPRWPFDCRTRSGCIVFMSIALIWER